MNKVIILFVLSISVISCNPNNPNLQNSVTEIPTYHVESIEEQARAAGTYIFGTNVKITISYDPSIPCKGYPIMEFAENIITSYYGCGYKVKNSIENVIEYYKKEMPILGFDEIKPSTLEVGNYAFSKGSENLRIRIYQQENEPGYTSIIMFY